MTYTNNSSISKHKLPFTILLATLTLKTPIKEKAMSLIDRFFNPSSQDKDWRGVALILFFAFVLPALWALYDNIKDILARRSREKALHEYSKKQKAEEIRQFAREKAAELLRDAELQKELTEKRKEARKKELLLIGIICSNNENTNERFAAWNILCIRSSYEDPTAEPHLTSSYGPISIQDLETLCCSAIDESLKNIAKDIRQKYLTQMGKFKAHERVIGKLS